MLVIPIIESVKGGKNIQELCSVPGADIFFVGPADYSSSAGYRGQWEGPGVAEAVKGILQTIRAAGKNCGIVTAGPENLLERQQQGFRVLGVGLDTTLLLRSLHESLRAVGKDACIQASLSPETMDGPKPPLARPPESYRPDRQEVINEAGKNRAIQLAPGILLDALVGKHNAARNLTTGLVTFEPRADLAYHTHPVSESITVLTGNAIAGAEGREYELGPLDNMVIPAGVAHSVRNASATKSALLHVALASEAPTRELALVRFDAIPTTLPPPGKERLNRYVTAPRSTAGPGTTFIDHFNKNLMSGIEMSGGYGLFAPGGRLPAHFHDFDESICIIQGTATCIVEGRRYAMCNGCTAMVPRGRVHFFVNETNEPMAMLWVYAGPLPERIVVDERCATSEGNPWSDDKNG